MQLIIVSIISTIGGLFGIWLINQNWFKRQEVKYKYKLRELKERGKQKLPKNAPESPSLLGNAGTLLNLVRGLDPDQIGTLIDIVGGNETPESGGDFLTDLVQNNPELVQSFINGLTKGNKSDEQKPGFQSQNQ